MKHNICKCILAMLITISALPLFAQNNKDWEPTGVWPFINRQFKAATVYTGIYSKAKTIVPCNIHIGNHTLWYSQNDTLMEAIPKSVLRVEFPNGDVYMPVGSEQMFGRIVREDTIDGRIARIIHVTTVNRQKLDSNSVDALNSSQNMLQGASAIGLGLFASALADANSGRKIEEEPLPLNNIYFFQVRGEIFQATTKNILAHIPPKRQKEYRNFTRTAEIISTNESSMHKIWQEFFLK